MSRIYHRLSRLVAMLPASSGEIAEDLDVTLHAVGVWTRQLRAAGVIRAGKLRQRDGRVFEPGPGRPYDRADRERPPRGVVIFAAAWDLLASRRTCDDIAEALSVTRKTASTVLLAMRRNGLVRIAGWELRHQTYAPIYDRLPARDAPRPGRVPRGEVNARHWARRRDGLTEARAA